MSVSHSYIITFFNPAFHVLYNYIPFFVNVHFICYSAAIYVTVLLLTIAYVPVEKDFKCAAIQQNDKSDRSIDIQHRT